jgi:hypothetical protein
MARNLETVLLIKLRLRAEFVGRNGIVGIPAFANYHVISR